jgi:hypothetical protein
LRSFKQSFGEPPHRYWTARRIERAKALLANPRASITEISRSDSAQRVRSAPRFIGSRVRRRRTAWDIAFSRDPEQRFVFLADGQNNRVRIIVRDTLVEVTAFGDGGRQPGQFYGVHSIATDSKGNIYTTETWEGKRLQKFVYKGIGNVMAANQGVLWPKR